MREKKMTLQDLANYIPQWIRDDEAAQAELVAEDPDDIETGQYYAGRVDRLIDVLETIKEYTGIEPQNEPPNMSLHTGEPEFLWVDETFGDSKVQRARDQLRSQPGRWALLEERVGLFYVGWAESLGSEDGFEITHVKADGFSMTKNIYGRYVG